MRSIISPMAIIAAANARNMESMSGRLWRWALAISLGFIMRRRGVWGQRGGWGGFFDDSGGLRGAGLGGYD